jgi:aminoglycoside phosphotransferase (APT) family kinase protein
MVIPIRRKISSQRFSDIYNVDFMAGLFRRRAFKYFGQPSLSFKLSRLEIVRNFLNKFTNLALKYTLLVNGKKIIIRGRADATNDAPQRCFRVLQLLKKSGFAHAPVPLDYLPQFNLLLYKDIPGVPLSEMLNSQEGALIVFALIPSLAKLLKEFHAIPPDKLSYDIFQKSKDILQKETKHWLSLVKKGPQGVQKEYQTRISKMLIFLPYLKPLAQGSLVHGDFHLGNIIAYRHRLYFFDFGDSCRSDPFEDIGRFLAQTRLMTWHRFPHEFLPRYDKILSFFLGSYFGRDLTASERFRLAFWELFSLFQMSAIFIGFRQKWAKDEKDLRLYFSWMDEYLALLKNLISPAQTSSAE